MRRDNPQWVKYLLTIAVPGILCLALIVLYIMSGYREIATALPRDLVYAKARWTTNPIPHYRLKMIRDLELHSCEWEVEVQDERLIASLADTCSNHAIFGLSPSNTAIFHGSRSRLRSELPMPISAFFERLEQESTTVTFGHDARCGDLDVMKTIYDAQYGYPKQIIYTREQATPLNMGLQTYRKYVGDSAPAAVCLTYNTPTLGSIEIMLTSLD